MKDVPLGILGSGKGTNCRAILESNRSGVLAAEVRVVISDVFDAPILDIAREFSIPNAYLPPGRFHTRLEPQAEVDHLNFILKFVAAGIALPSIKDRHACDIEVMQDIKRDVILAANVIGQPSRSRDAEALC